MFQNSAKPKAIFNMLLQLQNRLNIVDRLKKWRLDVDLKCVLCQLHPESRDHIYTSCVFSHQVKFKLLRCIWCVQVPYNIWDQYVLGILSSVKEKTQTAQIFKLVYSAYVYVIWIERNQKIFEKKSKNYESITEEIDYICSVRANRRLSKTFINRILTSKSPLFSYYLCFANSKLCHGLAIGL